jgi:hypothetical protein
MPADWIDQAELKADAAVFLPWLESELDTFLVPHNIQALANKWIPRLESLINDDKFREAYVAQINKESGAQPPAI